MHLLILYNDKGVYLMTPLVVYGIISTVLFLLPLIKIFIDLGKQMKQIEENSNDIHDLKVEQSDTTKALNDIARTLAEISTKVTLLIENRIKQ